ncbi:ABC transporter substrate-binding protein [Mesorhizobium sp. BR1-1-16]|uniref:ABC transporter substrate-binding protein n=1 Tax=Mesorhizobium sp. BR1-1-16 TaxID=2876653 RepID=UPI001CCEE4DB|nr:ABC transporter substrate-binding protein [Mesorhizobium sp. BR1-1-16]MBZ9939409.1 ABC transporter substrate-binding protein [Mesorhizobium sp. BR1-1-16]
MASALVPLLLAAGIAASAAAPREKTVIVAQSGQVNTIDPLRSDYGQTDLIDNVLYDTLVTYDRDNQIVGRLATEFVLAPDAKSVTVTLRPGVTFHDGAPLTAKDVAFTFDRLKRLGVGVASLVDAYESATITDDTHLTLNLSRPSSLFLGALSKIYILNSALVTANAGADDGQAWLQSHDAGSGPFMADERTGAEISASAFPGYWEKVDNRPEAFIFRRIDEQATKRDELIAGNIDLAVFIGDRDVPALQKGPDTAVALPKTSEQTEIVFNTRTGPTANPAVRKAIRLAFDYDGAFKNIISGNGELANGPLPNSLACRPDLPIVKQDLAAAKKILDDAGIKDLTVAMKFQPAKETSKQEAALLQSNLKSIGVNLVLEPIAFPAYLQSLKNVDSIPQMMLLVDFAQFPDPGIVLYKGYKSDAIGTNRSGYSNPEVDKLLDQALASGDAAARCDIYKKVQEIVDADSVMVDMYTLNAPNGYRKDRIQEPPPSKVVDPLAPIEIRLAP